VESSILGRQGGIGRAIRAGETDYSTTTARAVRWFEPWVSRTQ
jgi:hypothetical protein